MARSNRNLFTTIRSEAASSRQSFLQRLVEERKGAES